jgi:chitodextrinase
VLKGRKVRLSWSASTDNLGVAGYQVVRSSVQIASPAGTTYTHRPPKGAFMYQVGARDAAGNVSGLSPAVSVTT